MQLLYKNEDAYIMYTEKYNILNCKYIIDNYNTEMQPYGWQDFLGNSSGYSTTWVTSAILSFSYGFLPEFILENFKKQFRLFIHPDNGVGYSLSTLSDCDSTVFFIKACLALNISPRFVVDQIQFILNHQCDNGGFRTYLSEDLLGNWKSNKYLRFRGWTSDHTCVSSAVLDLFASHNYFQSNYFEHISRLLSYLSMKQNEDGSLDSYWWYTKYYSTIYTLNALLKLNKKDSVLFKNAKNFVLDTFSKNFWTNGISNEPCILSSALCLDFLINDDYYENKNMVDNGVSFLLRSMNQSDGSWTSNPILKIPDPDTLPNVEQNYIFNGRGVGTCSNDPFNLYTTSLIARVLNNYQHYST